MKLPEAVQPWPKRRPLVRAAASVAAVLAASQAISSTSPAATLTWTGSSDALWDTPANWSGGLQPAAGDNVIFPSPIPGTGATISLPFNAAASNLTFNNNYTLHDGTLSISAAGGAVTTATGTSSTILSGVGGSGGITKLGAGTLTLGGTNVYTGTTTVSAGTLATTSIGALATGGVSIGASGTLQVNQSLTAGSITNNGTLSIAASRTLSFASNLNSFTQAAGTLTIGSGATLSLNNNTFNYAGGTINGSVTLAGNNSTLNTTAATGTAGFQFTGTGGTVTGNTTAGTTLLVRPAAGSSLNLNLPSSFANNGAFTVGSAVSEGAFLMVGGGSGTFTNNGAFTINPGSAGGTRSISGSFTNAAAATASINHDSLFGSITNSGAFGIAAGKTVSFASNLNSFTQSAGTLTVTGALSLNNNAFNYNGGQVLGSVTLAGSNPALNIAAGVTGGGTFNFAGTGATVTGNPSASMTLNFNPSTGSSMNVTVGSTFTNNGALTMSSAGAEGVFIMVGSGSGTITNNGTFTIQPGGTRSISGSFTNAAAGTVAVNANTLTGAITNSGLFTIASGRTVSFASNLNAFTQSDGTLTVNGALALNNNAFNYTGGTVAGAVTMSGSNPTLDLGAGAGGGTFHFDGTGGAITGNTPASLTVNARPSTGSSMNLNVGSAFTNNGAFTLAGAAGEGAFLMVGGGSGTFTNHGTFTVDPGSAGGTRSISGSLANSATGVVNINQTLLTGTITNAGAFTIAAGKTVSFASNLNSFTQSGGTLTATGALSLNNNAFVYNGGSVTGSAVTLAGSNPTLDIGTNAGGGTFEFTGTGGAITGLNAPAGMTINVRPATGSAMNFTLPTGFNNAGTMTLSSASTEGVFVMVGGGSGTMTNNGTLNLSAGGARTISGAVINWTGATLNVNAATSFASLNNSGALNVNANVTLSNPSNNFGQAAGATVIAPGATLTTTTSAFNYTGGTIELASGAITPGTLTLAGAVAIGGTASGLTIASTGSAAVPGTLNLAGGNRILNVTDGAAADDLTISARVNTGSITKQGAGTLVLSGANNYGATSIENGTIRAVGGNALSDGATLNFPAAVGASRRLEIVGGHELTGPINAGATNAALFVDAAASLTATSNSAGTFAGVISGAGVLRKGGTGTWSFSGTAANTLTGLTEINAGTLRLAKGNGVNAIAGNVIVNNAGTLLWANNEQIANTATLTLNAGGTINLAGFTETVGSFIDNGGTTVLGAGGALLLAGDLQLANGTTIAADTDLAQNLAYTGATIAATISGNLTLTGGITHTFNIADGAADPDVLISGALGGGPTNHLTKTGAGALRLSGGGSVGDVNVNAGVVRHTAGSLAVQKLALNDGNMVLAAPITVANNVFVGDGSANNVTMDHSAGPLTMSGSGTTMIIGRSASAGGVYNLSGTGDVNIGTRTLAIGAFGQATLNQSGGSLTAGEIQIAANSNTATYALTGGTAAAASLYVGGRSGAAGGTGGVSVAPGASLTVAGRTHVYAAGTLNVTGGTFITGSLSGSAGGTIAAAVPFTVGADNISTTFAGTIGGAGGITKTGAGTLAITGTQSWSSGATITVAGGAVRLDTDAGAGVAGRTLTVTASGGSATFTASQTLAALNISNGQTVTLAGSGERVIDVNALGFAGSTGNWSGRLDLTDAALTVRYPAATPGAGAATLAQVTNQIKSGMNYPAGFWDGAAGITSSTAAADAGYHFGLGVADNAVWEYESFAGKPVDLNAILVKYTLLGDATLDGVVDVGDLASIDTALNNPGYSGWMWGDFNYDGVIDRDNDYAILVDSLYFLRTELTPEMHAIMARIEAGATPEPGSALVAGLGLGAVCIRRRKRAAESTRAAGGAGVH